MRMDVTHSVTTRISHRLPAQWDDSYRNQPMYPYIMEGPYAVHQFADDDEQAAAGLPKSSGQRSSPTMS